MAESKKPSHGHDHNDHDDHDDHHDHDHHQHGHHHGHQHGHGHSHHVANFGRAFAVGIALNLTFVIIEAGYGFFSNSLALLSDAGHNLSDVLGLALAWFATWLARRQPTSQFTYGLRSSSILAAVINAVVLLLAVGAIIWQAVLRFQNPAPINTEMMMIIASVGIAVNGFTAYLFSSGHSDLNIRGAFLHMLADAFISAGVVIAGFLIFKTGLTWIDPVVSIVIGLVIVWSTWGLLKDSVAMALAGVPEGIDRAAVEKFLLSHEDISRVHDLHIWALSTSQTALTAHLVRATNELPDRFLFDLGTRLNEKFRIGHVTLQIENGNDTRYSCPLDTNNCV